MAGRSESWRGRDVSILITRSLILRALGIGLLVGWAELALHLAYRSWSIHIPMNSLRTNQHAFWMIPLGDAALFALSGLVLEGLARVWPRTVKILFWPYFSGLATLSLLVSVEGVHVVAVVLATLGAALRIGGWLARSAHRFRQVGLAAVSVSLVGLCVLVGVGSSWVISSETRTLSSRPAAEPGQKNLLWIVLDTVRAESLSLYGHPRPTSPRLEALAQRGVQFTRAQSPSSWTLPAHATMFTARWPHELSIGWDRALDASVPTLADFLAGRGYATAAFVANTFYGNARYGLGRGFARYEDYYENQQINAFEVVRSTGLGKLLLRPFGVTIDLDRGEGGVRKSAAMINRDTLAWLDNRPADRPFFLFANYFDAHSPYELPADLETPKFGTSQLPRERQQEILLNYQRAFTNGKPRPGEDLEALKRDTTEVFRDAYESCIAHLDAQIGKLLDQLEARGLLEQTVVIITSDHGESFQEHGFYGHGMSLYQQEIHVPLVILAPGKENAGAVVEREVSLRDLAATAADLLDIEQDSPFPGHSLTSLWSSGSQGLDDEISPAFAELDQRSELAPVPHVPATLAPSWSITAEGRAYVRTGKQLEAIFDLGSDPAQQRNLLTAAAAASYRDQVERVLSDTHPAEKSSVRAWEKESSLEQIRVKEYAEVTPEAEKKGRNRRK